MRSLLGVVRVMMFFFAISLINIITEMKFDIFQYM